MFVYAIRSKETKRRYLKVIGNFFEFIGFEGSLDEKSKSFVMKSRGNQSWTSANVMKYMSYQKERAERIEIPKILKGMPQNSKFILLKIKEKHPGFCDDNYLCQCKNQSSKTPEWQHQVKWAIQDLKYNSIIKVNETTKFYSMRK